MIIAFEIEIICVTLLFEPHGEKVYHFICIYKLCEVILGIGDKNILSIDSWQKFKNYLLKY